MAVVSTVPGVLALAQIAPVRRVGAKTAVSTGSLLAPGGQLGAGGPRVSWGTNTPGAAGGAGGATGGGGGDWRETNPSILLTLHLASLWGGAGTAGCLPVVT